MSHVACHQQYARTEGVHVSIKSAPVHILAQSSIVLQYNNTNLTMVAKFVIVLSLAVAAYAVPLVPVSKVVYAEPEAPAHYEFSYSVHDDHSGDVKQQQEARQGDAVHGSYSLVQPDGVHRIVEYTADKEHGFNANVRYEGTPVQAAPAKIAYAAPVAKVAYAAPVAKVAYAPAAVSYSHAPVYAAPVAKVAYAAPVAKFVIVLSLAVAAYAVPLVPVSKVVYAEPEAPAHYEFSYSVHDDHSGDVKQQQEARQGDAVHGSYSLVQPDGVHRIVEYTADKEHGFNANVRYEGTPVQAAPAKIAYAAPVAKIAYAAPVAKVAYAPAAVSYSHAPVYAAPVAKVAYAAPVAKVAYSAPVAHVTYSSPAISYHH
ncbi:cuticle protein-like isoform X34 [Spodoptera frugiperda]|uniref:Cuticle protein-like isoform X34 n=1 Tax=Spodoptera frugiperda TaxID=7108 RepID=A0A9R0EEE8_SPOFR|nr:cuticle protein-like isoform X34 [Spodoptera frugiperda]